MKRALAWLLAACLLLSGCTRGESREETKPAGGVTLRVVTSYGPTDGNRANYEAAIASYERSTGNTVSDNSALANEEWKLKVMADFQTGSEPDVLFYFMNADSDALVRAEKVVPLEEIRAEYPDYAGNMDDGKMTPSPVDGKVYGVPVNGYWEGMYYNRRVLQAAGVEVPGADYTWSQFIEDCQKIRDAGYTPIAVSLQEIPHYWFEFLVYNQNWDTPHSSLPNYAGDEVGLQWAAALNMFKYLYERGFFPRNTMTATDAETSQLLADGQAAFLVDGSWKIGYFRERCGENLGDIGVTYVPGGGGRAATDIIGGISMGYFITRKAWEDPERRDAAVEFVQYMTSNEQINTFAIASGSPVTALNDPLSAMGQMDNLQQEGVEMYLGATSVTPAVQDLLSAGAREALFRNIKNVAAGHISAGTAVANALQ